MVADNAGLCGRAADRLSHAHASSGGWIVAVIGAFGAVTL